VFSDLEASKYQVCYSSQLVFYVRELVIVFYVFYIKKWPWLTALTYYLRQMAEYRISIYRRKKSEWDQMASWIVNNELYSENVVWLIQVMPYSLLLFLVLWHIFL
jgi:adenosine deaminase